MVTLSELRPNIDIKNDMNSIDIHYTFVNFLCLSIMTINKQWK